MPSSCAAANTALTKLPSENTSRKCSIFSPLALLAWQGEPWQIEKARCVREYTDPALTERFGDLERNPS